jgi:integrase
VLGPLNVEEVDTTAVLKVLEPIWTEIPETASRVRGRIETILDFAGRSDANPARWKGHLEHKLAKRNKARTVEHLAALPYTEIAAFMAELRTVNSIPAMALEFTILTACRSGEVLGARWSEIDLAKRLWTIPASRTKRDKQHAVPLSDASVDVLEAMAAIRDDDRIFPINATAMLGALKELRTGVTVHGFRATFRSWCGACTTTPRDVAELALGHSIGSAVEQAYLRDSLLAKRSVLMAEWAAFCGHQPASIVRLDVGSKRPAPPNSDQTAEIRADEGAIIRKEIPG